MSAETLTPPQELPSRPRQITEQAAGELPLNQDSVEAIALQFNPRAEIDNEGLSRTVFEYQGKTFSFQGREETPDYPAVENGNPTYLGHESVWLTHPSTKEAPKLDKSSWDYLKEAGWTEEQLQAKHEEDVAKWQTERDRLTGFRDNLYKLHETNTDKPEHFWVEQSPLGVYSLMEHLQPENPRWKEEREAVERGEYDESTLLLIDTITGVNALSPVNAYGDDIETHPPLGETVVVAGLLGDENAQGLASAAAQAQTDKETAKRLEAGNRAKEWANQESVQKIEAFKPQDLVVVHATSYEPEAGNGSYLVQTTHDATGYPRSTVHTAINHKVESHLFGDWDDKDYVLIAGLDKMIEKNGGPNSSNGADTWWTRNPGEKLEFPEGTLIAPGGAQSELVTRDGSHVSYKTKGITGADIEALGLAAVEQLRKALNSSDRTIELSSTDGQRIAANIIRDSVVADEIVQVRGKQWLNQMDDKFMSPDTGIRLEKMYTELGLSVPAGLHNGDSNELMYESSAAKGERSNFGGNYDPKIRRVAYASGMMNGGGEDYRLYLQRKDNEGWL